MPLGVGHRALEPEGAPAGGAGARGCAGTAALQALRWAAAGLALALAVACGSSGSALRGEAATAEADYLEGLDELTSGNYPEAIAAFQAVARAPRYVRWSSLAQLRTGDALFYQSKYAEAAQQYSAFISQNEGDANVPYASYMMGRAYFEQIPGDWFLTPPAFENDRQSLERCRQELRSFIRRYPRSRFLPAVREMLAFAEAMEYGFNEYVASYYEGREKPGGVAVRLEHMLATWPNVASTVENFDRLARAYAAQERYDDALRTLQRALERHPRGEHVERMTDAMRTYREKSAPSEPPGPSE